MNFILSSRGLFALSFILLVATNIVVLYGVTSNRSGEPESQITLTERELQLPYRVREENSGLGLRLTWRTLGKAEDYNIYSNYHSPFWLNSEKLEELGFNVGDYLGSGRNKKYFKQPIPKEVFIVLENDGEPYKEAVKRAELVVEREKKAFTLNPDDKKLRGSFERAEKRLHRERVAASRLFAIDAGLDSAQLREKYGDRTRFIIVKGSVKRKSYRSKKTNEVVGYLSRLSITNIHIPLEYRQIFDTILAQNKSRSSGSGSPRFEVSLAYGSRLEPWIMSVNHLRDRLTEN
jgi:hypothetical protein